MFFSEIGDIRATLCTIEASSKPHQVVKHLKTIETKVRRLIGRLEGDKKC